MLDLAHIAKSYPPHPPVLGGVSLQAFPGEVLCLVGESGSGKSTLLRIAAGLLDADAGTVSLDGARVPGPSERLVPGHARIRLLPQGFGLPPNLRAHEHLRTFLMQWPKARQEARVAELLGRLGLEGLAQRYPRELSGGQQQRLALARALADRPAVLLLDEPFSQLDAALKAELQESIAQLAREEGTAVLLATHDLHDAMRMAARAAVLRQGLLEQLGTPEALYRAPRNRYVASLFGRPNWVPAAVARQWPGAPQGPASGWACIREWGMAAREGGMPASVEASCPLGGYAETLARLPDGTGLRWQHPGRPMAPGSTLRIAILWEETAWLDA